MSTRALMAAALAALAVAPAVAAGGSRQTASIGFDSGRPGQSTGTRLAIDYANPDDAAAKPPAVQTVVIRLAAGARIDTSVPGRCGASDQELMASGAGACPAGSRVGTGELDADTGTAGPARVLQNDVTLLNNTGELILLLESKSRPTSRLVARAVVKGGTITSQVPPLPGGPPDGFLAIKRVRLRTDPRPGYITTPPACPSSRTWTNRISFTYRDNATQTTANSSPCGGRGRRRGDYKPPRIRVATRCSRGALRARVRIAERWSGLRSAQLFVDGRRRLVTTRHVFARRMRLRGGRHRLTVVAVDNAGNRSVKRARFRKCA